ncbi:MAG TPA: hypothetical protein VGQ77_10615 [Methylomirabilota bacterium]|jgi:hypothetical protein|nr:hypothetical protein [Methylomirabilota bacterium]
MRRAALPFALFVVAVLTIGGPAWAHNRSSVSGAPAAPTEATAAPVVATPLEIISAGTPEPSLPFAALLLLGAVGVAALSRQRRVVAVTLVAIVALLAFETGVHSMHHLGKPDDGAQCAVAWMSAQLSADVVDVTVETPALAPQANAPVLASSVFAERAIAPDAGRAPPALPA